MRLSLQLFILIMISAASAAAQHISGVVVDATTGEPLPFVNIIINEDPARGIVADLDGRFSISDKNVNTLTFSYVGYISQKITPATEQLRVQLQPDKQVLNEVVVVAGENPAHRIINQVIQNKPLNDPAKVSSYTYTSYNKFYITGGDRVDSSYQGTYNLSTGFDSLKGEERTRAEDSFYQAQHLFIMETVSEKKFKAPAKSREKVVATRVSGLKNPQFFILATQYQSFSFYDNYIKILETNYLNPISNGSTKRYFFALEDTVYSGVDTVFIISFKPKRGANFTSMKGLLYINTNNYALQNVIAEPVDSASVKVRIRQKYELIDGQWFPVQLHTDMTFYEIIINSKFTQGIGRTYLKNISINPEIPKKEFNKYYLELKDSIKSRDDNFWNSQRVDSLTEKESQTYVVIDSLGDKANLEENLEVYQNLFNGIIPIGPLSWDAMKLLRYNRYEGVRLEANAATNVRFSKNLKLLGYFAYGFRDKAIKYQLGAEYSLSGKNEIKLRLAHTEDVWAVGRYTFFNDNSATTEDGLWDLFVGDMFQFAQTELSSTFRLSRSISGQLGVARQYSTIASDYALAAEGAASAAVENFLFYETELKLRYAYREKLALVRNKVHSLGSDYPIFWLNIATGGAAAAEAEYIKIVGKVEKGFLLKNLGVLTAHASAGYADGPLPFYKLFVPKGSNYKNSFLFTRYTFNTMPMHGYLSDKFVYGFLEHDFGSLLIKTDKFQPRLLITTGVIFGGLDNPAAHQNREFKVPYHGYYESGLVIEEIYRLRIGQLFNLGLGAGVFAKYGPYSEDLWYKNFALRLHFSND